MRLILRLSVAVIGVLVLAFVFHAARTGARSTPPAAGPASGGFPPNSAVTYRLSSGGNLLQPLNGRSLADRAGRILSTGLPASSRQFTSVIPTPSGRQFLVVNQRGRSETLQLFDTRSGRALSLRQRTGVPIGIIAVSADGTIAYGVHIHSTNTPCQETEFYSLDTRTGRTLRHFRIAVNVSEPVLVGPAQRYLYVMTAMTTFCPDDRTRHPAIAVYDLQTGARVGNVSLTGVTAGSWLENRTVNGSRLLDDWSPGFALSPDGTQIAVLDGNSNELTLVAAPSLRVEGTENVTRPASGADGLAAVFGLAPAAAEAKGQLQGVSLDVQYMPNGRSLLVTGTRFHPDRTRPTGQAESVGIELITTTSGRVTARWRDASRMVGVWPAPDGSAVWSEAQEWKTGTGWHWRVILRRHSPATLRVLATRGFPHTSWLSLVFLRRAHQDTTA